MSEFGTVSSVPERAGPRAGRPGIDYIRSMVQLLHPGASVEVRRLPSSSAAREWSILPTASAPRIIVPTKPRAAYLQALEGHMRPGEQNTAMRLALVAAKVGSLSLAPRLSVRGATSSGIETELARILDETVVVSMPVGRERALQKPVLRVISETGRTLAFAKIGVSDVTRELVDHEARVLGVLTAHHLRCLTVPRVIAHHVWNGLSLLVQEPLNPVQQATPQQVEAAAIEISSLGGPLVCPLPQSATWNRIVDRVRALPISDSARQLNKAIVDLEISGNERLIGSGNWHGDFAPWNIGSNGGRLLVWDWEGYSSSVPLGADLLHHHFQRAVVVGDVHPRRAAADLAFASSHLLREWPLQDKDLAVALYFVLVAVSALESGDDQARISRLDDWFLASIGEQVRRLGHSR